MITVSLPGQPIIELHHLVSDVNGTLAIDGVLIDGVAQALPALAKRLQLHLLTADTHARQDFIDQQLGRQAVRIGPGGEAAKAAYVHALGADGVVAIGQGANDAGMLKAARIGICVLSAEGVATQCLLASDLFVESISSAFELLEEPARLVAGLRQ